MPEPVEFVVVANRLPVDLVTDDDGGQRWQAAPGGLVSAVAPARQRGLATEPEPPRLQLAGPGGESPGGEHEAAHDSVPSRPVCATMFLAG